MIEPVLREINNYYFYTSPLKAEGVADSVILCDTGDLEVGQYVYINKHPNLTGVYRIEAIEETGVRVKDIADTTLRFDVYPLAVPQGVIDLANAVELFNDKNPLALASEGLGDYSVSYSASNGVASWQSAFSKQLTSYRKVYLELPSRWN